MFQFNVMLLIFISILMLMWIHPLTALLSSIRICKILSNKVGSYVYLKSKSVNSDDIEVNAIMNISVSLLDHFNTRMLNPKVQLFSSYENYIKTLPVRMHRSEFVPLYTLSYLASKSELNRLAKDMLRSEPVGVRGIIGYGCAPSNSGKTACVLPAFLASTQFDDGFTHYIYIPFENNNDGTFTSTDREYLSTNTYIAEGQGAAFMVDCIKSRFNSEVKGPFHIPIQKSPPSIVTSEVELTTFLTNNLGDRYKCLFHIDEHYKMIDREGRGEQGAAFSRGALSVLAYNSNRVKCMATFIKPPDMAAIGASSNICRYPIPIPSTDIHQVLDVLGLNNLLLSNSKEAARLYDTFLFRLKIKIKSLGYLESFHRRVDGSEADLFIKKLKSTRSLETRIALCAVVFDNKGKLNELATNLLLGMEDESSLDSKIDEPYLVNGETTSSFRNLLRLTDPNIPVYSSGRSLVKDILQATEPIDIFSSTPLEAMYAWTLSCRLAMFGEIEFSRKKSFRSGCSELTPGRIFGSDNDTSVYDLSSIKRSTLYYVEETIGTPTHPLCDIFFLADKNTLVLIDIYGGSARGETSKKKKKLTGWIQQEESSIMNKYGYTVRGIVLSPNDVDRISENSTAISLSGSYARKFLGGLNQLFD